MPKKYNVYFKNSTVNRGCGRPCFVMCPKKNVKKKKKPSNTNPPSGGGGGGTNPPSGGGDSNIVQEFSCTQASYDMSDKHFDNFFDDPEHKSLIKAFRYLIPDELKDGDGNVDLNLAKDSHTLLNNYNNTRELEANKKFQTVRVNIFLNGFHLEAGAYLRQGNRSLYTFNQTLDKDIYHSVLINNNNIEVPGDINDDPIQLYDKYNTILNSSSIGQVGNPNNPIFVLEPGCSFTLNKASKIKIHMLVTNGYNIESGDKLYYLNPYYSSHREFTIPSLPKTFTKAKNNTEDNSIEIPLDGGEIFFTQSSSFFLSTSSDQTKESNIDGNKYPIFLIINDELDINNINNDNTLNLVFKPNNINTIDPFNSIDETNAENMINKIFEDVIKQSNINSLKNRLLAITPSTEKVIFGEVDNSDEHYGKNKLGALSAFLSLAMNYVNYTSCSNGCKDVSELLQQFGFSKINADLIKTYLVKIDEID